MLLKELVELLEESAVSSRTSVPEEYYKFRSDLMRLSLSYAQLVGAAKGNGLQKEDVQMLVNSAVGHVFSNVVESQMPNTSSQPSNLPEMNRSKDKKKRRGFFGN